METRGLPVASSCCAPAEPAAAASSSVSCCAPASADVASAGETAGDLGELLARYNVNDYAASVKVFAVKPRGE